MMHKIYNILSTPVTGPVIGILTGDGDEEDRPRGGFGGVLILVIPSIC